jgi:hypothetical protein
MRRGRRVCGGRWALLAGLVLALAVALGAGVLRSPVRAQEPRAEPGEGPSLSRRVLDPLGEPVHDAEVLALASGHCHPDRRQSVAFHPVLGVLLMHWELSEMRPF